MNDSIYSINYSSLSGTVLGSFIEQKIKRAIIVDKCFYEIIKLRYVWDFTPSNNDISKDIFQLDYENYKKIN